MYVRISSTGIGIYGRYECVPSKGRLRGQNDQLLGRKRRNELPYFHSVLLDEKIRRIHHIWSKVGYSHQACMYPTILQDAYF